MDDLGFLEDAATEDSTAVLMVLLPDGSVFQIPRISPYIVIDTCPLLFHAFELAATGVRQASIEATSRAAVLALLRVAYTGSYLPDEEEQLGCFLLHAEVFKIADDFDVPELKVQAYVNFVREIEISCSSATPPPDLCDTIEFFYGHLGNQQQHQQHQLQGLLENLLNYCLSIFEYQGLAQYEEFRKVVYENPTFHQDLCKMNLQRNFEDAGAADILQLPVRPSSPSPQDLILRRALVDFQHELWQDVEDTVQDEDQDGPRPKRRRVSNDCYTLVDRTRTTNGEVEVVTESESESESSSDEHGFTVVLRPKLEGNDTQETLLDSLTSTPTLVPSSPVQAPRVPAAALSDDWEWLL